MTKALSTSFTHSTRFPNDLPFVIPFIHVREFHALSLSLLLTISSDCLLKSDETERILNIYVYSNCLLTLISASWTSVSMTTSLFRRLKRLLIIAILRCKHCTVCVLSFSMRLTESPFSTEQKLSWRTIYLKSRLHQFSVVLWFKFVEKSSSFWSNIHTIGRCESRDFKIYKVQYINFLCRRICYLRLCQTLMVHSSSIEHQVWSGNVPVCLYSTHIYMHRYIYIYVCLCVRI